MTTLEDDLTVVMVIKIITNWKQCTTILELHALDSGLLCERHISNPSSPLINIVENRATHIVINSMKDMNICTFGSSAAYNWFEVVF